MKIELKPLETKAKLIAKRRAPVHKPTRAIKSGKEYNRAKNKKQID